MPRLNIGPFGGQIPRLDKHLLPENNAQAALNCYLKNGTLKPAQGLLDSGVSLASGSRSFYLYNRDANAGEGFWFQWSAAGVRVVPSPIVDDSYKRVYFTGDGVPKYTAADVATAGGGPYPSASYDLGLPAPNAPVAVAPVGSPPSGTQKITTAYVMTFVDKYGAEGPPSPPSALVDRWDLGGSVQLNNLQVASGNFVVTHKRIYRVELQGVYQFVAEISASATSYLDGVSSQMLGAVLPSDTWLAPHSEMTGLTGLPNGAMMGWWGNNIAFSEPYRPHAWPIEYRHALDDEIVGAAVSDVGIIVATKGKPYLLTGATPDSITENKLDANTPGTSIRSVVDMGSYVVYASNEGLVGNAGIITAAHMTAEQFAELNPASFHAYRWSDRYLCFYDNGTKGAFTFHPDEGFLFYSMHGEFGYQESATQNIYLKNFTQAPLRIWHQGVPTPYTWRSKVFQNPLGRVPNCAKVHAETYPVNVQFIGDGQTLKNITVQNRRAFRLPNTAHYDDLEIQVTGTSTVKSIQIADQMAEL